MQCLVTVVLLPMATMPLDPVLRRYCLDINQYHMLCSLLKISESIPLRLTCFRDWGGPVPEQVLQGANLDKETALPNSCVPYLCLQA